MVGIFTRPLCMANYGASWVPVSRNPRQTDPQTHGQDGATGNLPEAAHHGAYPEHWKYPYMLGDLAIDQPNQIWCSNIAYIPAR